MELIPLDSLPESAHPVAIPSIADDETLDRYQRAFSRLRGQRTPADWAIIVAMEEAAPDLAVRDTEPTNFFAGDTAVPQLRPPVQGGSINQS